MTTPFRFLVQRVASFLATLGFLGSGLSPAQETTVVFETDFEILPAAVTGETLLEASGPFAGLGADGNEIGGNFLVNGSVGNPAASTVIDLEALPDHTHLDLDFVLAAFESWDGNDSRSGPDSFTVVVDGVVRFDALISNFNDARASIDPALRFHLGNLLGNSSWPEAVFDLTDAPQLSRIPHTADSVKIEIFAWGAGYFGRPDEWWALDNLKVTTIQEETAPPERRPVDIALLIDSSGSMGGEIASVKANINAFLSGLEAEGLDYAITAIRYGNGSNRDGSIPNKGYFYPDSTTFREVVLLPIAAQGGSAHGLDALFLAAQSLQWRPEALKVIIHFSDTRDEGSSTSEAEATQALLDRGIIVNAITTGNPLWERIRIATGGERRGLTEDFGVVLEAIKEDINESFFAINLASDPEGVATLSGEGVYGLRTPVTVEATPNPGETFLEWVEDGEVVSLDNPYQFTAGESRNLTAVFRKKATIALSDLEQVFDGSPKPVTAISNPPGIEIEVRYDGELSAPSAVGDYQVEALIDTRYYSGQASALLRIRNDQAIEFPSLAVGPQVIPLNATASSGLPVGFTSSPSLVAKVENSPGGPVLRVLQGGLVRVTARQDGNDSFWPVSTSQDLRLPPVIRSFTAGGVELVDGATLVRDGVVLAVDARDRSGIEKAEFFTRQFGQSEWSLIGEDTTPGDALSVPLPLATLGDGSFELRVVVTTPDAFTSEKIVAVIFTLRPVLELALSETLLEGMTTGGTVRINRARTTDLNVTVSSSSPGSLSVDGPVIIPAGLTEAPFNVNAVQNEIIQGLRTVEVSASSPNALPATATVDLLDDDIPLLTLSTSRNFASESAGAQAFRARLERSPASSQSVTLSLTSSDPSVVTLPPRITLPAGEASVEFFVGAIDDDLVDGPQTATISAEIRLPGFGAVATSNEIALEVGDDDGPVLALTPRADYVREGGEIIIEVARQGTGLDQALEVALQSDFPTELVVPAVVTIPANASSVTFAATAPDNGIDDGGRAVSLSATATDFGPGQTRIWLTDESLSDLVVSEVTMPGSTETETEFRVSYRITNQGLAPNPSGFLQRVYLSEDRIIGNDILLSQYNFTSTLAPGISFDRRETVRAPRGEGTYWILVQTDALNEIGEILETNNSDFSATPIEVKAAYDVVVKAGVEQVPANTSIPLSGRATRPGGGAAANVLVNLYIRRGDTERVIAALTNSLGEFSTKWRPLPGEGGSYQVAASHPGSPGGPDQDSFTILTLDTDFPTAVIRFDEASSASFNGSLANPTTQELTGLSLQTGDLPDGLTIEFTGLPGSLSPGESVQVGVIASAASGFSGSETILILLTTDQGVNLEIPVQIEVRALVPLLTVVPDSLRGSVVRGTQKTVDFVIHNSGGAPSGAVEILLPAVPWISLASPATLPSIPPGGAANVSLILQPGPTEELTLFNGNMLVRASNARDTNLPFGFRVVSDQFGDLEVSVVDEYFYFTEEAPRVEGATVVVRDAISSEEISRATTGADGILTFTDLAEGWYSLEIDSPNHSRVRENYFINAGQLNQEQIFITRELVTYNWTVEEIEIEDRYRITVETSFETNVPAPVLTVEPARLDVEDLVTLGQTKVVNLVLENHGFISVDAAEFVFASHPFYEITPLIQNVGSIPAKSSITIPVTLRRIGDFAEDGTIITLGGKSNRPGHKSTRTRVPCDIPAGVRWRYECGPNGVLKRTPIPVSGVRGFCETGGPVYPRQRGDGGDGGRGRLYLAPVALSSPSPCDCPSWLFGADGEACFGGEVSLSIPGVLSKFANAITRVLPAGARIQRIDAKISGGGEVCLCCKDGNTGTSRKGEVTLEVSGQVNFGAGTPPALIPPATGPWRIESAGLEANLGLELELGGSITIKSEKPCNEEGKTCISGRIGLKAFAGVSAGASVRATYLPQGVAYEGSIDGRVGVAGSLEVNGEWCSGEEGRIQACAKLDLVASLSGSLKRVGSTGRTAEFKPISLGGRIELANLCFPSDKAKFRKKSTGLPIDKLFSDVGFAPVDFSEDILSDAEVLRLPEVAALVPDGDGVCARVKVRLDQEAVTTRSAFRGTLELTNNLENDPLTGVGFDLDVRDAEGQPANDLFNIRVTDLSGLNAVDGTGTINASETGSAQWTLIPRDSAAPSEETTYTIGGTITYVQGGTDFNIPVEPMPITVRPDAALFLKYFHQRDVFSDDPHTDEIEPSVPYALAVMVANQGAGDAHNLSITSAQPEIVDNEKGLFIEFATIATEVAGENLSPSMTANFGTIPAGETKIATWLMTSTLQGLFIDFEASFEHLDSFGDQRISLIKEVEIHEMIHLVEALGDKDDGLPDFLVNDIPDPDDLPDTIHLSNGPIEPVTVFQSETVNRTPSLQNLAITIDTPLAAGWGYLRIPDPADGGLRLVSVVRSDGLTLPLDRNAWTTDRTFIGLGRRPVYENILHLVDCDSTGSYTLTYAPLADADQSAPASQVTALPAQSAISIPVTWSGSDDSGVASYDVFLQINDGPWDIWLDDTMRTTSVYNGTMGEKYAFYSVATDFAGNEESKGPAAEATTTVSSVNAAPVVSAPPTVVIREGETMRFTVTASDPDDVTASLRYSLESGVPGIVINSATGEVSWTTGESDGGRQVEVIVKATDNGFPSATGMQSVSVTVLEENADPTLAPVPPQETRAGQPFAITLRATDPDFPVQDLRFRLGDDSPGGVAIDDLSGRLTWTAGPGDVGQAHVVTVIVRDNGSPAREDSVSFPVTVLEAAEVDGGTPLFAPLPAPLLLAGGTYSLTVNATAGDNEMVTLTGEVNSLPGNASFSGEEGAGVGTLTWEIPAGTTGSFQIPISANSDSGVGNGLLEIQVSEPNVYWEWILQELGQDRSRNDYEMATDLEGDGATNLQEFALLRDPQVNDATNLAITSVGMIDDLFEVVDMEFERRAESVPFVEIGPEQSHDLLEWKTIPPDLWQAALLEKRRVAPGFHADKVRFRMYFDTAAPERFLRIEALPRSEQ